MGFVMGRPLREFDEYPALVDAYRRLGLKRGLRKGREQGIEQGLQHGLEQGLEQGLSYSVAMVLQARGFELTENARQRLQHCHDQDQLTRWLTRATTVHAVEELFEPVDVRHPSESDALDRQ